MNLEETLNWLAQYGKPRVAKTDRGWYCCIDVFVTGQGVSFEVQSEFGCATSLMAAQLCKTRLLEALEKISKSVPTLKG